MIAVTHSSWADPFFAENEDIRVNRLSTWEYEFKSITSGYDYEWDFGDESPTFTNGYEVIHVYTAPGPVTVKVTVQTDEGPRTGEIDLELPNGADAPAEPESRELEAA